MWGVKIQNFTTDGGGKRVYQDVSIAFFNYNVSQSFERGGAFAGAETPEKFFGFLENLCNRMLFPFGMIIKVH